MGALIASGDENIVTAFANCGSSLGRAFQIRDDMLGIWGNEAATGKAVGNDIRRKKKSFPIVYALENAVTPPDKSWLRFTVKRNWTNRTCRMS